MQQEVSSDCWLKLSCRRQRLSAVCHAFLPKLRRLCTPSRGQELENDCSALCSLLCRKVLASLGRGTGCQPLGRSSQMGRPASRLQPGSRREHGTRSRKRATYTQGDPGCSTTLGFVCAAISVFAHYVALHSVQAHIQPRMSLRCGCNVFLTRRPSSTLSAKKRARAFSHSPRPRNLPPQRQTCSAPLSTISHLLLLVYPLPTSRCSR